MVENKEYPHNWEMLYLDQDCFNLFSQQTVLPENIIILLIKINSRNSFGEIIIMIQLIRNFTKNQHHKHQREPL